MGILSDSIKKYIDQQQPSKLSRSQTKISSTNENKKSQTVTPQQSKLPIQNKKSQTVTPQQSKLPIQNKIPAAKSVIEIAKNRAHRIFLKDQSKP